MTLFRIYLRVTSSHLASWEITEKLGAHPDSSEDVGTKKNLNSPPRRHTDWRKEALDGNATARPEEAEDVIMSWGHEFAERLKELSSIDDVHVSLVIVQKIYNINSSDETGIFFSNGLIKWLAVAGAALDVDQYILHECGDTT